MYVTFFLSIFNSILSICNTLIYIMVGGSCNTFDTCDRKLPDKNVYSDSSKCVFPIRVVSHLAYMKSNHRYPLYIYIFIRVRKLDIYESNTYLALHVVPASLQTLHVHILAWFSAHPLLLFCVQHI